MNSETDKQEKEQDLKLLRESIGRLLDRAGGINRVRALRESQSNSDRGLWNSLAQAGFLGVLIGEENGGSEMGLPAAGVIAEEMGRSLAPEPFGLVAGLAAKLLSGLCPDDPLLAALLSGEALPALAWQERGPCGVSQTMETQLSGGTLSGKKSWVAGIAAADCLLVIAMTPDGQALCQIDVGARAAIDGVTMRSVDQADGGSLHEIEFANAPVRMLATGAKVEESLKTAIDTVTALAASELLGVSAAALDLTLEFLKTRKQFGKPIGSFQALQHRVVDMHLALEIATASIHDSLALMQVASNADERSRQASRAKARAGQIARKITREAIQMHGAVGYTDEFDIGLYLNRSLVLSVWLGDARLHRRRWFELRRTGGRQYG